MPILGVDISHYQGNPNFTQVKASGREFVVQKVSEGTSYVDPTLATNRKNAHAAGLIVGLYHFARTGTPQAEAAWFLKNVGALKAGEFLVLDQEIPNTVAWCKAWLDAVHAATGIRPLIYMNVSSSTGTAMGNWTQVAADYGLWLAKYDQNTTQPSVPYWGTPAMKQFYDKGVVPGIAGPCDVDVFFGTTTQLLAYGTPGAPTMATFDIDNPAHLARLHDAIWHGTSGASLIQNYRLGHGEWADTLLGAMEGRIQNEILPLELQSLKDALVALAAQPAAPSPSVSVDAGAIAGALLSNTAFLPGLAKAINDDADRRARDGDAHTGPVT